MLIADKASLRMQRTDQLLSAPQTMPSPADPTTLSRTLLLLLQIFYDLNCQDLPEFFETNIVPCMALLHKYLTWSRPELVSDDDEDEAGPLEKVRASICEIAQLYTQKYLEEFTMMEQFVETTWTLLTGLGQSVKYDIVGCFQPAIDIFKVICSPSTAITARQQGH